MSSHREAPEISKDPVADNADVYAFVSPDKPDTVTIISNFVPLQAPAGGPNFFEFGDDVLYSIYIDNDGDAQARHRVPVPVQDDAPATRTRSSTTRARSRRSRARAGTSASSTRSLGSTTARRRSSARTSRARRATSGPRSTPKYDGSRRVPRSTRSRSGETVFCGQRNDPFYVDLGAIFDLGDLRPFQNLHLISTSAAAGVDNTKAVNIHSIAIQVPISKLTKDGSTPNDVTSATAVLGVWSAASRRKVQDDRRGQRREGGVGPVDAGLAARQPALQRGGRPARQEGRWNAQQPARATPPTCRTSSTPSWPGSCRCSTRRCSRTSRR